MKTIKGFIGIAISLLLGSCAAEKEQITPVPFNEVTLTDGFWKNRMETEINVTVPFSVEQSETAVKRFRQAAAYMAGDTTQLPAPHRFISSDLYKVMEGVAYSLMLHPNDTLEQFMDSTIQLIGAAQEDDGYLYISHSCGNPNVEEMGEKPYSYVLHSHELYNVGHLYEAAVAYFQATGKKNFLDIAQKSARHINRVFFEGGDPKYNNGKPVMQAPGHEEIELALCKLYRVTGDTLYLHMAKRFLDIRGVTFHTEGEGVMADTYAQQHAPVKDQTQAVGHAVRAAYLYTAMAQVDALTGKNDYTKALNSIWNDLVTTRMHITGGLGAVAGMEGFGAQYELPNLTAYNETCAAVGNVFFNHSMFLESGEGKFLDIAELSLFNNALAGINLNGDRFFYVNPLEANGILRFNHGHGGRSKWFGCACCPPNISRLILQVPGYMYSYSKENIYLTLYGGSITKIPMKGTNVELIQESNYPFDGNVKLTVKPDKDVKFGLKLRVPTWANKNEFAPGGLYPYKKMKEENIILKINGKEQTYHIEKGFVSVNRTWKSGDEVILTLPMPVRMVECVPQVKENIGRTAIVRGPLVYCAEQIDNNGPVQRLYLNGSDEQAATVHYVPDGILKGIPQIHLDNQITLVPYYAWCNRGDNSSMLVWLRNEKPSKDEMAYEMAYVQNIKEIKVSSGISKEHEICDGQEGNNSNDSNISKWVSQTSGKQWVEIQFKEAFNLNALSVYWCENEGNIKTPQSWSAEYLSDGQWKNLQLYVTDSYQQEKDKFNVVHPASPIQVEAVRITIHTKPSKLVGVSEIRFE